MRAIFYLSCLAVTPVIMTTAWGMSKHPIGKVLWVVTSLALAGGIWMCGPLGK